MSNVPDDCQPGGDYTYILDSLGPFIGFVRLWAECLIVRPCTITIVALTFAKYSVKLIFPECEPPDDSVRMLAAVCICEKRNLLMIDLMRITFQAYWHSSTAGTCDGPPGSRTCSPMPSCWPSSSSWPLVWCSLATVSHSN